MAKTSVSRIRADDLNGWPGDGKFFLGASSGFPPDAVGATRPRPRAICKISKTALNLEQSLAATDVVRSTYLKRGQRRGSESFMTTLQAVFLGMMLSWTPSVLLMAYLLWRAPLEPEGHL